MSEGHNGGKILLVQPDTTPEALMEFVDHGTLPAGAYLEDIEVWMALGRVEDCDCDLLQCKCQIIRPHARNCAYRLCFTSPVDIGEVLDCDCGAAV